MLPFSFTVISPRYEDEVKARNDSLVPNMPNARGPSSGSPSRRSAIFARSASAAAFAFSEQLAISPNVSSLLRTSSTVFMSYIRTGTRSACAIGPANRP